MTNNSELRLAWAIDLRKWCGHPDSDASNDPPNCSNMGPLAGADTGHKRPYRCEREIDDPEGDAKLSLHSGREHPPGREYEPDTGRDEYEPEKEKAPVAEGVAVCSENGDVTHRKVVLD
jgi:hypothetical protein